MIRVSFQLMVAGLVLFAANAMAENWPQKAVETFDGLCYRVEGRYDMVVSSGKAMNLKPLPEETLPAMLGMDSTEGAGFLVALDRETGTAILLGASRPDACSVMTQGIPVSSMRQLLVTNFRLKKVWTDDIGMQSSELFVLDGKTGSREELAENGAVMLTYSKDQSAPMVTIGFLPPHTAERVFEAR